MGILILYIPIFESCTEGMVFTYIYVYVSITTYS